MGDELGTEFSAACNKLRRVLQEKTGDGRLRDLETWLDYDGRSVFIAALWTDDEASVAVRFRLSAPISAADLILRCSSMRRKEASERHHDWRRRTRQSSRSGDLEAQHAPETRAGIPPFATVTTNATSQLTRPQTWCRRNAEFDKTSHSGPLTCH